MLRIDYILVSDKKNINVYAIIKMYNYAYISCSYKSKEEESAYGRYK